MDLSTVAAKGNDRPRLTFTLRRADIPTDGITLTIHQVVEKEHTYKGKPTGMFHFVSFKETDRELKCNPVNIRQLIETCGVSESEDMGGKMVKLTLKEGKDGNQYINIGRA